MTYYIKGKVGGEDMILAISDKEAQFFPADRVKLDPFSRNALRHR